MMATFREFLTEGTIGDLKLGMLPEAVENCLGPADDRSVKSRPVEILKFGAMELAFKYIPDTKDSRLIAIAIYFWDPARALPATVRFDDWTPTANTTEAEFGNFVESIGLKACMRDDGDSKDVMLDSGGSAVFADDRLHSIHFRRADKAPPRKQMSVSLPETTLEQLRARARRENISVQELIEKVLSTPA
jgi:hypothetical protein